MIRHGKSGNPDWPAVRAAYEGDELPLSEICKQFSLGLTALYRRARDEDWAMRRPPSDIGRRRHRENGDPSARVERLFARLFNAFELMIEDLERRLERRGTGRDAAARERDARSLATLVGAAEKLCALAEKRAAGGASASNRARPEPETVARMREAIARRIARLAPPGKP